MKIMKEVTLDIFKGISVSELANALKEKGETRAERMLRNSASATIRVHGKKVMENGKVLDVKWLEKKFARMRKGPNPPG